MNWEKKASIYRTFQAESEVAINKFNKGIITKTELDACLIDANNHLQSNLEEV